MKARKCELCGEWVLMDLDPVWRAYDPYPLTGDDVVTAIILGRDLVTPRILPMSALTILMTVTDHVNPERTYFAAHECFHAPATTSSTLTQVKKKPQNVNFLTSIKLSDNDVREFEKIWTMDVEEIHR